MKQTAAVRKMVPRHRALGIAKAVHIINDKGGVDHDSVRASLKARDEVTWFAHGNQRATISFDTADGSPFEDSVFHVPKGGSVSSGPAKGESSYKSYKYSVSGPGGKNDPVVIIDP